MAAPGGYQTRETADTQPMMHANYVDQHQYGQHADPYGQQHGQQHGNYTTHVAADPHGGHYEEPVGYPAGGGLQGVDKSLKWNLAFFAGAVCTVCAGLISTSYFAFHCFQVQTWSPATFLSSLCLTLFGLMMLILDFPLRTKDERLRSYKDCVYTFALFMTRFTGRGFWYLFLGSHCWVALFDDDVCRPLAIVFTLYLVLIGFAALWKGITLSRTLHRVQTIMTSQNRGGAEQYMPAGQHLMGKPDFMKMVISQSNDQNIFTEEEFTYVINALSFRPDHDNDLSYEEIQYWLKPSGSSWWMSMTLV